MFSLAIRWGWRSDNPCKGVERNQENKRHRYLTGAELGRLTKALAELRDQDAANAVRLLLLTGARRGELLAAKWADFDLDAGTWTKPASTTSSGPFIASRYRRRRAASSPRCARGDDDVEWLFPARRTPHRLDIDDGWAVLRKAASIPDVRLHDLRHTYASVLASAGLSLPVIGALLGHATPVTTHRYAHLFDDPLRQATERASAILAGKASADVVPLTGARRKS